MRVEQVEILATVGKDDALTWAGTDIVNWIPTAADAPSKSGMKLETPPGLRLFCSLGAGVTRCGYSAVGKMFVVAGSTLYEVRKDGTSSPRGTIPGAGRVMASHNQRALGHEFCFVNGSAGYVWNTQTSTFSKITDEAYPGSAVIDFADQYLVQVDPFGRYWFHSDLAKATEYNSLDRAQSEGSPDRIVSVVVNNGEVVVFNTNTTEFFYNSGATTGTFKNKKILMDKGCAGPYARIILDNSVLWLGSDGVIYRLDGYRPQAISTGAIEKAIRGKNWSKCFCYTVESPRHKIAYFSFPDGQTFGFDAVTQLWHRRKSAGLERWRLNWTANFDGIWLAGDYASGDVYQLDWDAYDENGEALESEWTTPDIYDANNPFSLNRLELLFDTGGPETSPPLVQESEITLFSDPNSTGVHLNSGEIFNSSLSGASSVVITGIYSPDTVLYEYPPSVFPLPVDLSGFTLSPVSHTLEESGPLWVDTSPTYITPNTYVYATISINGGPDRLALLSNNQVF